MYKSIKILVLFVFCLCVPLAVNAAQDNNATELAGWTFSDDASDRLVADIGVLSGQMRLSAIGHRGNNMVSPPVFGTGANAGQLLMGSWAAIPVRDRYWLIQSMLPVSSILVEYDMLEISFTSHSTNTGPRNFVLEANINGNWIYVADYILTNSAQNFTFQLPNEIKESEYFQIRLRVVNNTSVTGSSMTMAGTNHLFDIQLTGITIPCLMEDIAQWQFSSLDLFNNNATTATGGSHLASTFGLAGDGNLSIGTGSTFGQLFANGWGNASGLSDRYWHINTQTIGYRDVQISFSAHGSNTGPRNFVLEVNLGTGWIAVDNYILTTSGQRFDFNLPVFSFNAPELDIRLRPSDNISINNGIIQTAGTSRIYDIAIRGIPTSFISDSFTYTQDVAQDAEYAVVLLATGAQNMMDATFMLRYNPGTVTITDIRELANFTPAIYQEAGINIISQIDGILVFNINSTRIFEADALKIVVTFAAEVNGVITFVFEYNL